MQLRKYLPHRRDNNLIQRCIQRETFCIIIFVIKFIFISKVIASCNLVILIIIAFNKIKVIIEMKINDNKSEFNRALNLK